MALSKIFEIAGNKHTDGSMITLFKDTIYVNFRHLGNFQWMWKMDLDNDKFTRLVKDLVTIGLA